MRYMRWNEHLQKGFGIRGVPATVTRGTVGGGNGMASFDRRLCNAGLMFK
jgi:hypothetical protein